MQQDTLMMANRLGDSRSRAYALAAEIYVATIAAPKPLHEFERLKKEVIEAASNTVDVYIQSWTRFVIGWEEFHRGRMNDARASAHKLMQVGRRLNDPRSVGLGLGLLTWICVASASYAEALEYSDQSLAAAVTPADRYSALAGRGTALVLLRRTEEGTKLLTEHRRDCVALGALQYLTSTDAALNFCKILRGNIMEGIRGIEDAILKQENDGYRAAADLYRLNLAEVYLQIIERNETPPLSLLLKNLPIILTVMVTGFSRICALTTRVSANPHFHPEGHHAGRTQMILGLLYKLKRKRAPALEHLTEARRILSQFGQTPMLTRIEVALTELGQ